MGVITKKIKGTEDVLPKDSYRWQFVEDVMRKESAAYGFKEIRTPVFEHTELLQEVWVRQQMLFRKKCTHSIQRAEKVLHFVPRVRQAQQEQCLSTVL